MSANVLGFLLFFLNKKKQNEEFQSQSVRLGVEVKEIM